MRPRPLSATGILLALILAPGCSRQPSAPGTSSGPRGSGPFLVSAAEINEDFTDRQAFPPSNWWNQRVASAPVDPDSDAYIAWIGSANMHPDFGNPPYGIPYVGVAGDEARSLVHWTLYGSESDDGAPGFPPGFPIPAAAATQPNYIEGGVPGGGPGGDRHLILVDRDNWWLYELWYTQWNSGLGRWEAGSGAIFNLSTNDRRPEGWTSADAAGLAIYPGLVKYDEVFGNGAITHAFRVTVRATNGHVWPASHTAGSMSGALPMGARLRLRADFDTSGYPPGVRKILLAMKEYGLIVADNGSDLYVQGTMDDRWDNDVLNPAFHSVSAEDFEVVLLGWNGAVTGIPE